MNVTLNRITPTLNELKQSLHELYGDGSISVMH
jgi:hypothetical protein